MTLIPVWGRIGIPIVLARSGCSFNAFQGSMARVSNGAAGLEIAVMRPTDQVYADEVIE
jgi:hypothetical protein